MNKWSAKAGKITAIILALALTLGTTVGISAAKDDENGAITVSEPSKQTGTMTETGISGKTQAMSLSLEEATDLALRANHEIKTVAQDVYMREQDLKKARYFAEQIKDADDRAEKGEDMLALLKHQLNATPEDSAMYGYLEQQIKEIEQNLAAAGPYRVNNYNNAKVAYLYEKQAEAGLNLTQIGEKTARQKIALLVNKQYFDVVKYREIAQMKKAVLNRAQAQAEAAKASYGAGFRAKDDYLLAKAQYELMNADYMKSILDQQTAETELKATIGVDQSVQISLKGYSQVSAKPDLDKDLKQGLAKRLEIQKAQAELELMRLNFKLAQSYLGPGVVEYEQAQINVKKAEIELEKQKSRIEKEIIQAYQSLTTLENMSSTVKSTSELARESASIAEYRYKVGFSLPSPVMKALNSEDLAGTTVEVLAAQEKILEIEQKIIEIEYSCNLAKASYLVTVGEGL